MSKVKNETIVSLRTQEDEAENRLRSYLINNPG
jgi:hypothetical protein